jgi:hypothetical protein
VKDRSVRLCGVARDLECRDFAADQGSSACAAEAAPEQAAASAPLRRASTVTYIPAASKAAPAMATPRSRALFNRLRCSAIPES